MPPFAEGDRRIQSLNFVSTDLIDNYQISKSKADKVKEGDDLE